MSEHSCEVRTLQQLYAVLPTETSLYEPSFFWVCVCVRAATCVGVGSVLDCTLPTSALPLLL